MYGTIIGLGWIQVKQEILHGTPTFFGTRVPIQNLFDSMAEGESLEEFLEGYPSVSREMAIAAIDRACIEILKIAKP